MSDYKKYGLSEDPFQNFFEWLEEAKKLEKDANAFVLSTASKEGIPSARFLLFKGIKDQSFCFYTNYDSQKALDVLENPNACMSFYWPHTGKQIRISGDVIKMNESDSQEYFFSRGRESQMASIISKQSRPLSNREELDKAFREKFQELENKEIPYPENWGGFLLNPTKIEFFIYGEHRLNDRFLFSKNNDLWDIQRLWP